MTLTTKINCHLSQSVTLLIFINKKQTFEVSVSDYISVNYQITYLLFPGLNSSNNIWFLYAYVLIRIAIMKIFYLDILKNIKIFVRIL